MADFALELSFAADDERALLAVWRALYAAGLPSQADNARGMVNAPHLTFAVAAHLDDDVRARAQRDVVPVVPARLDVRGAVLLGSGVRVTLAYLVEPERRLAEAVLALRATVPGLRHPVWTPHVTLARRLPRNDVGAALAIAAGGPRTLVVDRVRWWNPTRAVVETL